MNETRKSAAQSLLETGALVLFRVVDTHTEFSPDKENVFVRAQLVFEDDDEDTDKGMEVQGSFEKGVAEVKRVVGDTVDYVTDVGSTR